MWVGLAGFGSLAALFGGFASRLFPHYAFLLLGHAVLAYLVDMAALTRSGYAWLANVALLTSRLGNKAGCRCYPMSSPYFPAFWRGSVPSLTVRSGRAFWHLLSRQPCASITNDKKPQLRPPSRMRQPR